MEYFGGENFGGRNFRQPKISVAGSAVGGKYGGEMRHAGREHASDVLKAGNEEGDSPKKISRKKNQSVR